MNGDVDLTGEKAVVDGMDELPDRSRQLAAQTPVAGGRQRNQDGLNAVASEGITHRVGLPHGEVRSTCPDTYGHEAPPKTEFGLLIANTERWTSWST